jgi:uncharacterized protein (DUF1800 family)
VELLAQFGQPVFGLRTPEGWPDKGAAWINSGAMIHRIGAAGAASNDAPPFAPLERWRGWRALSTQPLERQIDGTVRLLLGGVADSVTRFAMLATRETPELAGNDAAASARRLRALVAIALGSPEFQRR